MYTIQTVIGKVKNKFNAYSEWEVITNLDLKIVNLLTKYNLILVTVVTDSSSELIQYSLTEFKGINNVQDWVSIQHYFSTYNSVMPNSLLPIKSLNLVKRAYYHNIYKFGLQARRGLLSNIVITQSENYLPDIIISKPKTYPNALSTLTDKVLYLINGLVYLEEYSGNNLILKNGSYALDRYESENISVIDFSQLGGFQKLMLDSTNTSVFSQIQNEVSLHVHIPFSIDGKTPVLIFNRRLHILDKVYEPLTKNIISIRVNKKDLISEIVNIPANELSWVDYASVTGEGYQLNSIDILKCAVSGTSALIFLDTNELCVREEQLMTVGLVGSYLTSWPIAGILYHQDGSVGDYEVIKNGEFGTLLFTNKPKLVNDIKDTIPVSSIGSVNNNSLNFTDELTSAKMLHLYTL